MAHNPSDDLVALAALKAAADAIAEEIAEVEDRLVKSLTGRGRKTVTAPVDGETIKGTLVAGQRVYIDEARLKAALDSKQWGKVTKTVLDTEKLEAAVVQKIVDEKVVAAASEVRPSKPYIRVTGKVPPKNLPKVTLTNGTARAVIPASIAATRKRAVRPKRRP